MRLSLLLPAMGLFVLTSGCVTRRYTDLPELPPVPHDFHSLERHFQAVRIEGHPEPIVLSWVEAGEGPPLLLVHGLMTSAYSWRYVASTLARQFRVIAVDLPGAGRSGAPSGLAQSPQRLAAVLEAFARTLGLKKTYVVGNSMGGYVSLWWSLAHPEPLPPRRLAGADRARDRPLRPARAVPLSKPRRSYLRVAASSPA